jgi:sterol 3beta-glucosyltransferase
MQEARKVLGMSKASLFSPAPKALHAGEPFLLAFSRHVVPPAREWPQNVRVTGFLFLDGPKNRLPPPALLQFLDGGPPPVYFGFGSMNMKDAEETTETVLSLPQPHGTKMV